MAAIETYKEQNRGNAFPALFKIIKRPRICASCQHATGRDLSFYPLVRHLVSSPSQIKLSHSFQQVSHTKIIAYFFCSNMFGRFVRELGWFNFSSFINKSKAFRSTTSAEAEGVGCWSVRHIPERWSTWSCVRQFSWFSTLPIVIGRIICQGFCNNEEFNKY